MAVVSSSNCSLQDKNLGRKRLYSLPMDAAPGQTYSSGDDPQNGPKPPEMGLEVCSAQPPAQLSPGAPPVLWLVGLVGNPGFLSLNKLTMDLSLLKGNIGSWALLKRYLSLNQSQWECCHWLGRARAHPCNKLLWICGAGERGWLDEVGSQCSLQAAGFPGKEKRGGSYRHCEPWWLRPKGLVKGLIEEYLSALLWQMAGDAGGESAPALSPQSLLLSRWDLHSYFSPWVHNVTFLIKGAVPTHQPSSQRQ